MMAIYRNIQMSFWTDPLISDEYTPKDKLFYLYLLTNPHTNLCGCYEISVRQMANEIGYTGKEIEELLDRAERTFGAIAYSDATKELLVIRWHKYNWTSSAKFRTPLEKEIERIKDPEFKSYLTDLFNGIDTVYEIADTVSTTEEYGTDTTVTVSVTDKYKYTLNNIVDYMNSKCGTHYKVSTAGTRAKIIARLNEGYTEEDFKKVIDKKYDEWHGTDQEKYLRPETLFGPKFEGYLNQKINAPKKKQNAFGDFDQRDIDYDDLERQLLNRGGES